MVGKNKVSTSTLVVVLIEPDVRLGWLAAAYAVEHVRGRPGGGLVAQSRVHGSYLLSGLESVPVRVSG